MDEINKQMYRALFRGVPFLIESSKRSGGRKLAIHEYPNIDNQYVEDLGKVVPTFSIDAIISGQADYMAKRNAFIKALEDQGPGQLSHPFYGDMFVSVATYELDESTSNLGKAVFSVTFAITGLETYPKLDISGSPLIQIKVTNTVTLINAHISENYQPAGITSASVSSRLTQNYIPNKFNQSYNTSIISTVSAALNKACLAILALTNNLEPDMSHTRSYNSDMETNKNTIAIDGQSVADSITGGFDNINNLDADSDILYTGWKSCFDFRSNEKFPSITTVQKLRNLDNHLLITGCFNMLALIYAYQEAANIEFLIYDDLRKVQTELENQYQYILGIPKVDYDLLNAVQDIRSDSVKYFNNIGKQVYKITDAYTNVIPMTVLAYQYYGNLDYQTELIRLNNIKEPSFVAGNVKILTI